MNTRTRRRSVTIEAMEARALLTTITVNSIKDTTNPDDAFTTLREALAQAEIGDTIELTKPGRIILRKGELTVSRSVTINGLGPDQTIIDALGDSRVFGGASLTLNDLTVTGGRTSGKGGAIDAGHVTANNVHFTNNRAGRCHLCA